MELQEIFAQYVIGSQGFCIAVETHCGFEATRSEIERIAEKSTNADEFSAIWENEDWWVDGNQ